MFHYLQDDVVTCLLKSGKKEPAGLARCLAISSLGIFLYEELSHGTMHPKMKETINVLLATLKVIVNTCVSDINIREINETCQTIGKPV